MPIPSTGLAKHTPLHDAQPVIESYNNKNQWRCWKFDFSWNSHQEGTPDHGGLYIAQKVKTLREQSENFKNMKVILISDKLFDPNAKERIAGFLKSEISWFNYYDKTSWEEDTGDWPSHLNKPTVFKWAVIHAINERESRFWGDTMSSQDDSPLIVSKALKEIFIHCKTLGKDKRVNRILITGEKGTGKSLVAHTLHQIRKEALGIKGKLVTVECSSKSDQLFQSDLFGHIKGAYTSADTEKIGFVEAAKDGTLFFDEIGDLSPSNQGKVLRLLQENQYVKVGDNKDIKMDVSLVIFATNRDLDQMVEQGLFRADLYDRMNPPPMKIPSLRERRDEIDALAESFIEKAGKDIKLSDEAKKFLQAQEWEGNVRQLKNTIYRATTYCTSSELSAADLQKVIPVNLGKSPKQISASQINNQLKKIDFLPKNIIDGKIKWASIKNKPYHERAAVMVAVRSLWEGSQSQLAAHLEVSVNSLEQFFSTLRRKFKKNEIKIEDLKPYIAPDFYPSIGKFFQPAYSESSRPPIPIGSNDPFRA
jgi:DNA-binding NtrC family response regulator